MLGEEIVVLLRFLPYTICKLNDHINNVTLICKRPNISKIIVRLIEISLEITLLLSNDIYKDFDKHTINGVVTN